MTDEEKYEAVFKPVAFLFGYTRATGTDHQIRLSDWIKFIERRIKQMEYDSSLSEWVIDYNESNSVDINETIHILRQELIISKFNLES
jgi:ABC-type oligopeptide transport system substrate-binding subunit